MGIQQQMQVQMQLNSHVVEKTVKDQVLLTKQIAETGCVVAQLTLQRNTAPVFDEPERPKSHKSNSKAEFFTEGDEMHTTRSTFGAMRTRPNTANYNRHTRPKMHFPASDVTNPRIWRDKLFQDLQYQ